MARETKDLSYVVVFLCQEHQLRGICLRSLVIVNSLFGAHCALKCHNNTKAYTSAQTYVIFCWLKKHHRCLFLLLFFSFFFISMVAKKGLTCCKTAVQVPELSYALCVSVCVCVCECGPYSSCRSILSSTACRAAASEALVSSNFWCTNESTPNSVVVAAGAVTPPPDIPLSTDTPPMEDRGGLTGGGVGLGVAGV